MYEGKAVAPTTSLIASIQDSDEALAKYSSLTTLKFLKEFVRFITQLDKLLASQYRESGTRWLGREVTLAGLFGAIGSYADEHEKDRDQVMRDFIGVIKKNPKCLNLTKFEDVRNGLFTQRTSLV